MEKEPFIIGKNLTPEEKEKATAYIEKRQKEYLEPLEGEIEKTPEELKFIEKINTYLGEEFKEMGLKEKPSILPEQIHFLSSEAFDKRAEESNTIAFHDSLKKVAYFKKPEFTRLQLFKTMLHESLHIASFHKYYVDVEQREVIRHKVGYFGGKPFEKEHEHFRGFNEAVIDKTTREILRKHQKELIKKFNITPEEEREGIKWYRLNMDILNLIIRKIAEKKKEDENTVWQKFKKNQFTGEMMHLRDIEKIFGKGSLRIIAALGSGTKNLTEYKTDPKIFRYFETDDKNERDKIAKEVLIERERLKYQERQK